MKKIIIAFVLGLLLSALPITGFAKFGSPVTRTFRIQGGCPAFILIESSIPVFPAGATTQCCLTGEEAGDDGVSVCSYNCGENNAGYPGGCSASQ